VRLFEVCEFVRSEGKERERGGNVTSDVAKWGRGKRGEGREGKRGR